MTRSRRSILCEGRGGCWCQWEFSTLVLLVDGHRLWGGAEVKVGRRGDKAVLLSATQWPASGGGYQPQQLLAWLHLSGSECCFLRMFMTPGFLLLWNVLLFSHMCVCGTSSSQNNVAFAYGSAASPWSVTLALVELGTVKRTWRTRETKASHFLEKR